MSGGPGTELKAILHMLGIDSIPDCQCDEHRG